MYADHALYAIARLSVRPICHMGGSVKNVEVTVGLRNFHHTVAPSL